MQIKFSISDLSDLENFLKEIGIEEYYIGKVIKFRSTLSHKLGKTGLDIKAVKTMLDHSYIRTSAHYMESDYDYIKS